MARVKLEACGKTLLHPVEFIQELQRLTGGELQVDFTSNRTSLITVKPLKNGDRSVRIQHAFRAADFRTMGALASFIQGKGDSGRSAIQDFINNNQDLVAHFAQPPQAVRLMPRGQYKDLGRILDRVFIKQKLDNPGVNITWSSGSRGTRSIRFGSYVDKSQTIRIHPALDSNRVPDYFVEFVVYHELLHALYPPKAGRNGRRNIHSRTFRRMEQRFYRYQKARAFEQEFIKAYFRQKT